MNILILAGGKSARMGADKASIVRPDGQRQIDFIVGLAAGFSHQVFLSTRDGQDLGTGLPVIADLQPGGGPLAALAAAAAAGQAGPWLVLSCDLFLLDRETLKHLMAAHTSSGGAATAFRNRIDGLPEPLCAIYDEDRMKMASTFLEEGGHCARKFITAQEPHLLDLPHPAALDNANTPEDLAEAFAKLSRGVSEKQVTLLYFAGLREQRGLSSESVSTLACTAAGLYEELRFRHRFKLATPDLRVARNGEFEAWDVPVESGDEFVFIPPVAGG